MLGSLGEFAKFGEAYDQKESIKIASAMVPPKHS